MLARLYQPSGTGPFPATIQVHGGAWTSKDRTNNDFMATALAESGIVVLSLDFRMPPEAPYPASLQDINHGVRWLKAHAGDFQSRADWVGSFGTSSGGHQALLAAMRADDPRYSELPLPGVSNVDAKNAFVISGWGVLCPLLRYGLARDAEDRELLAAHDAFWIDEAAMSEGSPVLMLERGETCQLPPVLIFGGDADEWVPAELAQKFVANYRKAGGIAELTLYPGQDHQFMTGKPDAPLAKPALELMRAFIRKHTSG